MVAIPTLEEEDARRPGRERESLVGEKTRIINRMKSAFARLGIRGFKSSAAYDSPEPLNRMASLYRVMLRSAQSKMAPPQAAKLLVNAGLERLRRVSCCYVAVQELPSKYRSDITLFGCANVDFCNQSY